MQYELVDRRIAERNRRVTGTIDWDKLIKSIPQDKALRIICEDKLVYKRYAPRVYEAATRVGVEVETFKTVEDKIIYLNVITHVPDPF